MQNEGYEHEFHEYPFMRVIRIVGMVVGGVLIAVILAFLFGYVVMMLWNWLMPAVFGLTAITYWQAFGLIVLAKIFFGGGHGYGHGHGHNKWRKWKRHHHDSDWAPAGDYGNWKYYEDYWRAEGKKQFEDYLEKNKGKENQ
jgi:hypothetical protein